MYSEQLKKILGQEGFNKILKSNLSKCTFGQFGEDILINKILKDIPNGNYLDLGSFHPMQFSNTFTLYLKGWRGVNIDGNSRMINLSKQVRPLDINVHAYLSDKKKDIYYIENEKNPAMNRLVDTVEKLNDTEKPKLIKTSILNEILSKYKSHLKKLFYLNVDLEFNDLSILKTLDLEQYRPYLITIEVHNFQFYQQNDICKFLNKYNYSIYAYINPTAFYVKNNFKNYF